MSVSYALFLCAMVRVCSCLGTSKKLSLGVLIGVNYGCVSVKFRCFYNSIA